MYYYFKENVFYLRRDRDALFLKNNFYSISVNNPNSYTIFKMVLPYLNGSIDFDEEYIGKISNHVIKKFLISLIDILKKNGFVLYSENPININDYSKLEQSFLACYGGKISKKSKRQFESYVLSSPNEEVGETMCSILYNSNIKARLEPGQGNHICIDGPLKLFIHKSQDDVVVSSVCPKKDQADADFFNLPHHIFEIIASFFFFFLVLYSMGIHKADFSKEDYVFNLKLLCGSFVSIGERT